MLLLLVWTSGFVCIEEDDDGLREWREEVEEDADRWNGCDWDVARAMVVAATVMLLYNDVYAQWELVEIRKEREINNGKYDTGG